MPKELCELCSADIVEYKCYFCGRKLCDDCVMVFKFKYPLMNESELVCMYCYDKHKGKRK